MGKPLEMDGKTTSYYLDGNTSMGIPLEMDENHYQMAGNTSNKCWEYRPVGSNDSLVRQRVLCIFER